MSAAQIGEPWHDTFAHDFRTRSPAPTRRTP